MYEYAIYGVLEAVGYEGSGRIRRSMLSIGWCGNNSTSTREDRKMMLEHVVIR
jgi:hypothetical protein